MSDDLVEQLFLLGMDSMEYDVNEAYDPAPTEESELIHRAAHEIKLLRAFVASVSDVAKETHFPAITYRSNYSPDGSLTSGEVIVCYRCSTVSELHEEWPCSVYRIVHPDPEPLTELDVIGIRHIQHSRLCDCLGRSAECCDPPCGCHPKTDEGSADEVAPPTHDPFTVEFTQVDAGGNVSTYTGEMGNTSDTGGDDV